MRHAAKRILGKEFDVQLAEDASQAWVRVRDDSLIQVVFSDLVGPDGQDDLELIDRIRGAASPQIRDMPVVVITDGDDSPTSEARRKRALKNGVTDFVGKPFRPSELLARARAHASSAEAARRLRQVQVGHHQDAATGLGNRRYFFERLVQSLSFAQRHGHSLSVFHIHLKGLDKALKHAGPTVSQNRLARLGKLFFQAVRREDTVYRTGTEIFSFILPATDEVGADAVRCRLAPELDATGMLKGDGALKVKARFIIQAPDLTSGQPVDEIVAGIRAELSKMSMTAMPEPEPEKPPALSLDDMMSLIDSGDQDLILQKLPDLLSRLKPLLELAQKMEKPAGKGDQ